MGWRRRGFRFQIFGIREGAPYTGNPVSGNPRRQARCGGLFGGGFFAGDEVDFIAHGLFCPAGPF
jgi:hypothetical protein